MKDSLVVPVPYDFDFSGIVDAPYATIMTAFGQTEARERIYLGFERSPEELTQTIRIFEEKKDLLYQTIRDFKRLKANSRKKMIAYLDTFFESLPTDREIKFSAVWF